MKKLIILFAILLLCSCERNYNCRLDYAITYPDSTIVKHYEWDGDLYSNYYVDEYNIDKRKVLKISHKYVTWVWDKKEIDVVSTAEGGDIEIIKFRIFRKDDN